MSRIARFTVTLSQAVPDGGSVTLNYNTVDGTATAPSDYTSKSGTLSFQPGDTSKTVDVTVRDLDVIVDHDEAFTLAVSNVVGNGDVTITVTPPGSGTATLVANVDDSQKYYDRFISMWDTFFNPGNKYIGYDTAADRYGYPFHVSGKDSQIIMEDRLPTNSIHYGKQYSSENYSFFLGMQYWRDIIVNDPWTRSDPNTGTGPGVYNNLDVPYYNTEARYMPGEDRTDIGLLAPEPSGLGGYPVTPNPDIGLVGINTVRATINGVQGFYYEIFPNALSQQWGDMSGIQNPFTPNSPDTLNSETRGRTESVYQTSIPFYQPMLSNNGPNAYPSNASEIFRTDNILGYDNLDGITYNYTKTRSNPIADLGVIHWDTFTREMKTKLNVIGGYTRFPRYYASREWFNSLALGLVDRYGREVGNNQVAHNPSDNTGFTPVLPAISMFVEGVNINFADGTTNPPKAYQLGSSDVHHANQNIYAMTQLATNNSDFHIDVDADVLGLYNEVFTQQLVLLRWLQSPEGPIAGGITNSHNGNYTVPNDGRQNAKFMGMTYTYAPGKVNPPSNDSVEWQTIGHMNTADAFYDATYSGIQQSDTLTSTLLEVILDRLVKWFLSNVTVDGTTITVPTKLSWVSNTQVVGQTASVANTEGKFEYLPTLAVTDPNSLLDNTIPFWYSFNVPNPNLHCTIVSSGEDLGIATSLAYLLISYTAGKKLLGKLHQAIPNTDATPNDALNLATQILDVIWNNYKDETGIKETKVCTDYKKIHSNLQIKPETGTWSVFQDNVVTGAKFFDIRTPLKSDPRWAEVEAYASDSDNIVPAPTFEYHRSWVQCMYAIACAKYHLHFNVPPADPTPFG